MISSIYASLLALLILYLAIRVVRLRQKHRVLHGDQQIQELIVARSAHSNAIESIPITLILLVLLEFQKPSHWVLHLLGITFFMARLAHAQSILNHYLKGRVISMVITMLCILILALLNIVYTLG